MAFSRLEGKGKEEEECWNFTSVDTIAIVTSTCAQPRVNVINILRHSACCC